MIINIRKIQDQIIKALNKLSVLLIILHGNKVFEFREILFVNKSIAVRNALSSLFDHLKADNERMKIFLFSAT